jgi:glycosyltransferase involved in cell wall biosynthesis
MKIVHLLGWYFPDSVGGTEVYVNELCQRLRAAGHEVLVAAPTTAAVGTSCYVHNGVSVFRYAIPADPTRDEACSRVPVRGAEAFNAWLREERPDLLHLHSFTTACGLHEIREARRIGTRVIATCHLPGFGYMCRAGELMRRGTEPCDGVVERRKCADCNLARLGVPQAAARALSLMPMAASAAARHVPGKVGTALGMAASVVEYGSMQREVLALVERFIVLNETARGMLGANGWNGSKVAVNRLGIAPELVRPKPAPSEQPTRMPVRFGYVGRLHASKGLREIVLAVRHAPREIPFTIDVRGPIVDESSRLLERELREMAAGDPRVRFAPAVSRTDIAGTLAEYDVLLCPSVGYENGPTIALEAHAVGTPVIGSRVGNLAEIIQDGVNGRLIAPRDVSGWSSALVEAASDPRHTVDRWRDALSSSVRTMDDVAEDYLSMYAAS